MIHSLKTVQFVPISLDKAWDFFSSPENLKDITPASMNFEILSEIPSKMYPGMIISYNVSPFPGYRVNWVTEISHIKEKEYFVDSQLSGPYSIWHHEHHFKHVNGGVEMTDLLYYKLPFGAFGRIINHFLVRQKVEGIFSFRQKVLDEKFSAKK